MIGFYYSDETMFVPYYVTKDNLGIYANVEQRNFNMQPVICGRKLFVVYTGANSLIEIAETVMTERYRNKNRLTILMQKLSKSLNARLLLFQ